MAAAQPPRGASTVNSVSLLNKNRGETGHASYPVSAAESDPGLDFDDDLEWEEDADYVTVRPAGFRVARALIAVVVLVFIGVTVFGVVSSWFSSQLDPEGDPFGEVTFIVPAGATTGEIATILEDNEVIPNSTFFRYYAEWNNEEGFQAGEYTLANNMSAEEAIAGLRGGPRQIEFGEFTVIEGRWLTEIIPKIARDVPSVTEQELWDVLEGGELQTRYRPDALDVSAVDAEFVPDVALEWEGLLFPATYFIEDDITAVELLGKMNDEFARVTGAEGYGGAERTHNLSAYEVIIIASLVEAEAKTEGDRPKIARVIHNRLQQDIPIGIDATYIYAAHDRELQLFESVLEAPGPYNNRNQLGLPPTPISTPGQASLRAAMSPAEGTWLYYVRIDDEGNHAFAETLEEHNANVEIARELGYLDQ